CELMLRGPQTPGELRSRASRMAEFHDVSVVEDTLQALATREDGPFVVKLPREPGRRESRYAHLFAGPIDVQAAAAEPASSEPSSHDPRRPTLAESVAKLEANVARLQQVVENLRKI